MLAGVSTPSRLCSEPPTGHQVRSKLPFLWLPPERRTWRQGEEDVHQVARCWFPMSVLPGHIPWPVGTEPLLCQVGASGCSPAFGRIHALGAICHVLNMTVGSPMF